MGKIDYEEIRNRYTDKLSVKPKDADKWTDPKGFLNFYERFAGDFGMVRVDAIDYYRVCTLKDLTPQQLESVRAEVENDPYNDEFDVVATLSVLFLRSGQKIIVDYVLSEIDYCLAKYFYGTSDSEPEK